MTTSEVTWLHVSHMTNLRAQSWNLQYYLWVFREDPPPQQQQHNIIQQQLITWLSHDHNCMYIYVLTSAVLSLPACILLDQFTSKSKPQFHPPAQQAKVAALLVVLVGVDRTPLVAEHLHQCGMQLTCRRHRRRQEEAVLQELIKRRRMWMYNNYTQ